jgi:hypothetical protein
MYQRRKFMLNTGLAVGALATGAVNLIALETDPVKKAEADVLVAIKRFGTMTKQSKQADRVEFTVKLKSAESLGSVFSGETSSRFENVYADGNRLKFNHGGVGFTLTNVA